MGNLGQNPHGILFDEVIAQPNGELWDALKTGFGARTQPLMLAATTAGDDAAEFARLEHDFSMKVADDPSLDPRRFVYIRNLPQDVDWKDESRWGEPNPALGIFLRPQVLRDELTSATNNPREERAFKMFRLNQWQSGGVEGWAGAQTWSEQGNVQLIDRAALAGQRCWGGVVAASATDLAAASWTFKAANGVGTQTLWDYWLPEERLPDLNRRTSGKAEMWVKNGHLKLTEGNELDISAIVDRIRTAVKDWDVRELAYFSGNALGIIQPVIADRLVETVAISANTQGSSLVDWEQMLSRGEYVHAAHPITSWQVSHLQVRETTTGTPRVDIKGSPGNVYGVLAAELGLRRYLLGQNLRRSAYEDHDLVIA
jgi:phage terminase large subunit-like protein